MPNPSPAIAMLVLIQNHQTAYSMGDTPLHYAARTNDKEMAKTLLALGADRDVLNTEGQVCPAPRTS
jgi:ankyrin repeat protein